MIGIKAYTTEFIAYPKDNSPQKTFS